MLVDCAHIPSLGRVRCCVLERQKTKMMNFPFSCRRCIMMPQSSALPSPPAFWPATSSARRGALPSIALGISSRVAHGEQSKATTEASSLAHWTHAENEPTLQPGHLKHPEEWVQRISPSFWRPTNAEEEADGGDSKAADQTGVPRWLPLHATDSKQWRRAGSGESYRLSKPLLAFTGAHPRLRTAQPMLPPSLLATLQSAPPRPLAPTRGRCPKIPFPPTGCLIWAISWFFAVRMVDHKMQVKIKGPFLVPPASHEDEVPLFASYGIGIGAGIVLLWFVWVMFAICCPDDRPLVGRTLATCCNQCEWNYVIVALLLVNPELLAEPIKYIGKGGG